MAATQPNTSPSRIEAEVGRARSLLQKRQFSQALGAAEALLAEFPENRDVLYLIAVSQRYLGRISDALTTLGRFENLHPDYGRLFQERGHCYRALGDVPAAIASYQKAVDRNAALPASWKALSALCKSAGRIAEAENAANVAASLEQLPAAVVTANSLFSEGETHAAEQMIRQFLQQHPAHIEGMRLLARIGMKLEILDDAEFLLESVLEFAPDYHAARYDYAQVLIDRQKHAEALQEIRRLLAIEPRNPLFRSLQGNVLVGLGEHEAALELFYELRDEAPANPTLHLAIGHAHKTVGRQQEAIASYRRAAEVRPNFGDAYWSMANLKTYRFSDEEIAQMRAQESSRTTPMVDHYHLCFALGKALEDRGDFAESFRYYQLGNALKHDELRYDADALERNLRRQALVCTPELFAARHGAGSPDRSPIFIVGLPRAGSTLVEQILASHPAACGVGELRFWHAAVAEYEKSIEAGQASGGVISGLAGRYLRELAEFSTEALRVVDKMPANTINLGLIHATLPRARIIHMRRHPIDTCLSIYFQAFSTTHSYANDLEDLAHYYTQYFRVMEHWRSILPGDAILDVPYERLVEDPETWSRQMIEFIGLPWDPRCLKFDETERTVITASNWQVRQRISTSAAGRWRNYEKYLGALRALTELEP